MERETENPSEPVVLRFTVVRGVPGSGKTTVARRIAARTGAMFFEPDMSMVQNGEFLRLTPEERNQKRLSTITSMLFCMKTCMCDVVYCDVLPTMEELIPLFTSADGFMADSGAILDKRVVDTHKINFHTAFEMSTHYDDFAEIRDLCEAFVPWEDMFKRIDELKRRIDAENGDGENA